MERQVPPNLRFCLAHSLPAHMVEKAEVVKRRISRGKFSFQEQRMLHHTVIGTLAEHLDLGSRKSRGAGNPDDTSENATAAPTYGRFLYQCHAGSLTSSPSRGTVGERGSGDAVLDKNRADG